MAGLTYRQAGVDIDKGDALVERIRPLAARTRIAEVLGHIGGFAGLCQIPQGMKEPVLVSGTDGVGTKLKLAFAMDVHDTIGVDLVAMSVNDVVTTGARPLFFLDYFATSKLDVSRAERVIAGIADGCLQAGCALLGGETAELPGFYADGEYDLAGFAVGVVERASILDPINVKDGDAVIAVASSGLHSNGYSLARRALLEEARLDLRNPVAELGEPLGAALLRPTRIYAKAVAAALRTAGPRDVRAICHITGSGLPGNVPRILPDGFCAELDLRTYDRPPLFELIAQAGTIEEEEMTTVFNLGVGLVLIVAGAAASKICSALSETGERAWVFGHVGRVRPSQPQVQFLR